MLHKYYVQYSAIVPYQSLPKRRFDRRHRHKHPNTRPDNVTMLPAWEKLGRWDTHGVTGLLIFLGF
jgi:hypothetical protein